MSSDSAEIDVQTRQKLAARIVTIGPIAIAVLSVVIVGAAAFTNAGTGLKESTQLVFTAVLPLVGTWVGTVLAFYFAKENFEAASRATKEILGIDEKLKSILVSTVMIPISKIDAFKLGAAASIGGRNVVIPTNADEILINSALTFLAEKGRNRLPIFGASGENIYIVHVSTLDKFRSRQLLNPALAATPANWKIGDLHANDPQSFAGILAWACVAETATLADAKFAMETTPNCMDVIVTKTGQGTSPVVGWLTNVEIAQNSKA